MAALLTLFRHAARADLPVADRDLLDRFAVGRDEQAFAELVRRHGPVVYRICRRLVGPSAADDAFQAAFLVLATRLDAARAAGSVGGWLVGVAGRVARQMRRSAARRMYHETAAASARSADGADHPIDLADQFRVLDEELARLPGRLRDPVVLCLLQGRTQDEAGRELGRDARTLRRRLERAKRVLRARLERRGVVPAVAAGLITAAGSVSASVPSDLSNRTVSTVFDFLTGGAKRLAPVILAKGVATSMFTRKLTHLMALAAAGLIGVGVVMADDTRPIPAPRATQAAPVSAPGTPAKFEPAALDRAIHIRCVLVEVPVAFCAKIDLAEVRLGGQHGWALSRRESLMLHELFRAEKDLGRLKVLGEPVIVTHDNEPADMRIGQDVPIPAKINVREKDGKTITESTLEHRFTGVMIRVTPRSSPDGKSILLRAEASQTEMVPTPVELGNGLQAPAFNIQYFNLVTTVPDGGSLVVRGSTKKAGETPLTTLWVLTPQMVTAPPAVQPPAKGPAPVMPPVPAPPVPVQVPPQVADIPYINRLFPAAHPAPVPGVVPAPMPMPMLPPAPRP